MQYIKVHKKLVFILNPLLILLGVFLFCFFPHIIHHFFHAWWISFCCALFLMITSLGNQRLAEKTKEASLHLPWQQWIAYILLLEFSLLGVYNGMCFISGHAFIVNASANKNLFSQSLQTELLHFGLFPWSLYALIAVGMGVIAYNQQTDAYFSQLLKSFTKQEPQKAISAIINIGARRCTLFAVAIMLTFMTFFFVNLFLSPIMHITHGFQITTLFTTLILLMLAHTQIAKHYTNLLFSQPLSTIVSFPLFCIALGLILLIVSIVTNGIAQQASIPSTPDIISRWIDYNQSFAWSLFSVMWWICLTPLVCSFIARISKGYKIRHILIGVLALPFLIALYFMLCNHQLLSAFTPSPMIVKILICVSFLILLPLLINHANVSNTVVSYFPKNGVIKMRDQQPFFLKIMRMTVVFIYFYLVIGVNGISFFIFIPNYVTMLSLLVTSLAIVKNVFYNVRGKVSV